MLSYVQKTFLQAFRTSLGELAILEYPHLINFNTTDGVPEANDFYCSLNIMMIWAVWYAQTFTMIVVMLNFIISVINSTFDRVSQDQAIINYRYKAELNLETFDLLSYFRSMRHFKAIVFCRIKEE